MARGMEKPPMWATVVIVVSVVGLVVLGLVASARDSGLTPEQAAAINSEASARQNSAAAATSAAIEANRPRNVAFLGDSYTGGSDSDSGEAYRWPALVGEQLRWNPEYFAVGGSGYIAPGQDAPFSDRVDDIIAANPDIIIMAGGINDAQAYPAADIAAAALADLQRLRAGLPDVPIIVLSPFYPSLPTPDELYEASNAIQAVAATVPNTQWIDALSWFQDGSIEIKGAHPTDAGHARMAEEMLAALVQLGYTPPS